MKAYFPCGYFPPEKAASIYLTDNIVEDTVKAGFDVVVFTPMPTRGIDDEMRERYKRHPVEYRHEGHLKIVRFSLYREGGGSIKRALRYFICNFRHFCHGLTHHYDVAFIDSTPPTQGVVAGFLKMLKGVKIVYNLQDIFPDSLVATGIARQDGVFWKIGKWVESFTYKHADKIIVISEDFKKNIMAKGVPEDKIVVAYNWVNENDVVPIAKKDNPLYEEFGIDPDKFNVVYAGNLGSAQNIDIILDAAERTLSNKGIGYVIFGSEEQSAPYRDKVRERMLTNVRILPIQPFNRVSYVYSLGDVAIVPCKKGFGSIGMPSKTWSIMSSATAVLASFDGGTDMQRIIEDNKVGIFTEAGDIDAFTDAILTLYGNKEECAEMGRRGRQFILKNLTREIGTSKYVATLRSVAGRA